MKRSLDTNKFNDITLTEVKIPLTGEEIRVIYELDISLSEYVKRPIERSIYDEPITK